MEMLTTRAQLKITALSFNGRALSSLEIFKLLTLTRLQQRDGI